MRRAADQIFFSPSHMANVSRLGIDGRSIFDHPAIRPWRSLPDRENCLFEATTPDGGGVRWHVKRYAAVAGKTPAEIEAAGHQWLIERIIPTAPLVGHGVLADGRSFVISEDLAGYVPADKLIERGRPFTDLLEPTAALAAQLHDADLHHRDLYLCHFMAKIEGGSVDLKLIDVARVRPLPRWLRRRRWVVKDLAQFWYSAQRLGVDESTRSAWLSAYAARRGLAGVASLRRAVDRKSKAIERHDRRLKRKQPTRNVSIPT